MSEDTDKNWIKRLLTCDIKNTNELYTEESVDYDQDIENEIDKKI